MKICITISLIPSPHIIDVLIETNGTFYILTDIFLKKCLITRLRIDDVSIKLEFSHLMNELCSVMLKNWIMTFLIFRPHVFDVFLESLALPFNYCRMIFKESGPDDSAGNAHLHWYCITELENGLAVSAQDLHDPMASCLPRNPLQQHHSKLSENTEIGHSAAHAPNLVLLQDEPGSYMLGYLM